MKLGKLPARPGAVKLRFSDYLDLSKLPTPPAEFGHETLVTDWGLLGNDSAGDCVWAGGGHETILWNIEAGHRVSFSTANTLADYMAVTGYNPNDPSTDQGTDMQVAADYRLKTGLLDANGNRHRIGAYLAITAGNLQEHLIASYLFGAVGIGITFPLSAMHQFDAGQPWDIVPGATIDGGHYIPLVSFRGGLLNVVTWGKVQPMTEAFFASQNDESLAYLSPEMLIDGKSLEGFDLAQLQSDFNDLKTAGHSHELRTIRRSSCSIVAHLSSRLIRYPHGIWCHARGELGDDSDAGCGSAWIADIGRLVAHRQYSCRHHCASVQAQECRYSSATDYSASAREGSGRQAAG
jgi:hypothetical protein